MNDRLLAAVLDRVNRCDTGDLGAVLGEEALVEARELWRTSTGPDGGTDIRAVRVIALLHWFRFRFGPPGSGYDDWQSALRLFIGLRDVDPDFVPAEVAGELHEVCSSKYDDPVWWWMEALRLSRGYHESSRMELLEAAVVLLRRGVAVAPAGHSRRSTIVNLLGLAIRERFERLGRLSDLTQAIEAARDAVRCAKGEAQRTSARESLIAGLCMRYEVVREESNVAEAVSIGRAAVEAVSRDAPHRFGLVKHLASALLLHFEHSGQVGDLDEALELVRDALSATGTDDGDALGTLGILLRTRFEQTGREDDLNEAVEVLRRAANTALVSRDQRSRNLSNLGFALRVLFERTGGAVDIDEAVAACRESVAATAPGERNCGARLLNLAGTLRVRFGHTGQSRDLDEAIHFGRASLAELPAGHVHRAQALTTTAMCLMDRFKRGDSWTDVEESVDLARSALELAPVSHPDSTSYLSNLVSVLQIRAAMTRQRHDVTDLIELFGNVLDGVSGDRPSHAVLLSNLAGLLQLQYEFSGDERYLHEAVVTSEKAAAASSDDHPNRAPYLYNLGLTYRHRYAISGERSDLASAITCWRQAVNVSSAPAGVRVNSARAWGVNVAGTGDMDSAAEAFSAAVELLPVLAWHGLERVTREDHLTGHAGLAQDAVACVTSTGESGRALELLEQGRAIIWTQLLHVRSDLDVLAERAPELADRMNRVRMQLDSERSYPSGAADVGAPRSAGLWRS